MMCKECKKLIELYAETQLECMRFNKNIVRVIVYKCPMCGESVFVAADIKDNFSLSLSFDDNSFCEPPLNEIQK